MTPWPAVDGVVPDNLQALHNYLKFGTANIEGFYSDVFLPF